MFCAHGLLCGLRAKSRKGESQMRVPHIISVFGGIAINSEFGFHLTYFSMMVLYTEM